MFKGNSKNVQYPFHWHEVVLNLPSAINYDPGLTRVKIVPEDNKGAEESIYFFDDGRAHGPAGGLFNTALHTVWTGLRYLGKYNYSAQVFITCIATKCLEC